MRNLSSGNYFLLVDNELQLKFVNIKWAIIPFRKLEGENIKVGDQNFFHSLIISILFLSSCFNSQIKSKSYKKSEKANSSILINQKSGIVINN